MGETRITCTEDLEWAPFNAEFLLEGGGDIDFGQNTEALILEAARTTVSASPIGRSIVISMASCRPPHASFITCAGPLRWRSHRPPPARF